MKMMKGFIVSEVVTVIYMVALLVIITIGITIVLFTFNNQIRFSTEYASIINKPYSVSEPLFLRKIDDRTILDHSFSSVVVGNTKLSEIQTNFASDVKVFMDLYSLKYYHFKIEKNEALLKVTTIKKFCGTLDQDSKIVNTCGTSHDKPCIAYCESGTKLTTGYRTVSYGNDVQIEEYRYVCSSSGKIEFASGSNACRDSPDSICCIEENYDWSAKVFTGPLRQGEKTCSGNKGICSKTCEAGRDEGPEDRACDVVNKGTIYNSVTREKCCVPKDVEEVNSITSITSEVVVPVLYKTTKNDKEGVKGYIKIGVGID
ncbi:MAG: hypothetical protein HY831_03265 [Candidatus Aenigmarchaeota archaeon]|nr:hypothetical protein [Candidatus Aenigmarchaeota archaeon]